MYTVDEKLFYSGRFISVHRDDVNNPLHPNLWADLCVDLDLNPETTNAVDLKVVKVKVTDASQ